MSILGFSQKTHQSQPVLLEVLGEQSEAGMMTQEMSQSLEITPIIAFPWGQYAVGHDCLKVARHSKRRGMKVAENKKDFGSWKPRDHHLHGLTQKHWVITFERFGLIKSQIQLYRLLPA